ncbi:MAG: MFS transporter [Calditrichaeota bacterium]|nr:MAG: MFS transporter [Calditrichota bacterium]
MEKSLEAKQKKRAQWAWYLFDFGNSAYAAVVLLAVYAAYFKQSVVGTAQGSALWGLSLTISMLVVAIISPFLGALADYSGRKKLLLFVMTAISIIFTGLLFFVQKGDILLGMVLFIVAEIGYRSGQVFYNSLLVDIADEDEIAKVSGNGWAFGSIGGIVCLLIVLVLIQTNPGNTTFVRLSMLITAVFFALFAIPTFLYIKEPHRPQKKNGKSLFRVAVERLSKTIKSVMHYKEFLKFMIALLIYNDGIIAALDFAAIIGAVIFGVTTVELIIFVIIVQITNVIGAFVYGILGEKIGLKNALVNSLVVMLISVVGMLFVPNKMGYFIVGSLAGFAMAGVQSLDRTLVSVFAPKNRNAEFYGFFSLAGRTSSIIGPGVMGLAATGLSAWILNFLVKNNLASAADPNAMQVAEKIGHRFALVTLVFFLLVGMMPLLFVNEEEGRKAAKISDEAEA